MSRHTKNKNSKLAADVYQIDKPAYLGGLFSKESTSSSCYYYSRLEIDKVSELLETNVGDIASKLIDFQKVLDKFSSNIKTA
jgi:hypothetical protein